MQLRLWLPPVWDMVRILRIVCAIRFCHPMALIATMQLDATVAVVAGVHVPAATSAVVTSASSCHTPGPPPQCRPDRHTGRCRAVGWTVHSLKWSDSERIANRIKRRVVVPLSTITGSDTLRHAGQSGCRQFNAQPTSAGLDVLDTSKRIPCIGQTEGIQAHARIGGTHAQSFPGSE